MQVNIKDLCQENGEGEHENWSVGGTPAAARSCRYQKLNGLS